LIWSKSLTVKEKILLHLLAYAKYSDQEEVPNHVTQQGIAEVISAPRPHVSMALKDLREQELIIQRTCHITQGKRRQKVNFLTHSGLKLASSLKQRVMDSEIKVLSGTGEHVMRVADACSQNNLSMFELINRLSDNGVLDLSVHPNKQVQATSPQTGPRYTSTKPDIRQVKTKDKDIKTQITQITPIERHISKQPEHFQIRREQSRATNIYKDQKHPKPSTFSEYSQQYPSSQDQYYQDSEYQYGYPPYPSSEPAFELSLKANIILFFSSYFLIMIGIIFGLYLMNTNEIISIIPMILFLVFGITFLGLSTQALWSDPIWQKKVLSILVVTFPVMLYTVFYVLFEPDLSYYDLVLWLIIIFSFFALANYGTFIPLSSRAEALGALGTLLIIIAPVALLVEEINIFPAGFWILIGFLCIYLDSNLLLDETLELEPKMATGLILGIGLGILVSIFIFINNTTIPSNVEIRASIYGIIILWFINSIILFTIAFRPKGKLAHECISLFKSSLPMFFGIVLFFFGIFLFRFDKTIETIAELFLGGMLILYGIKRINYKEQNKTNFAFLILFSIAVILTLVYFSFY